MSHQRVPPDPAPVEATEKTGGHFPRMSPDKLSSDRIGEELNPDASIWRLYMEEAKGYDAGLARERNANLDTMLLFATLFSAIVTAFVIESTNLLEQDLSEVSTQLLLTLAQSQQRIEAGVPNPTSLSVNIPGFTPSATARLINVLWFDALMISLGAAVVAILAKEWLVAFTMYRTRHPHEYALQRQARFAALYTWNMLPIIDLLPTFLNLALFVFSLGLIIRLWLLDHVVAAFITVIGAAVCGAYLFFIISGAVHERSPYKARISTYIHLERVIPQSIRKYFILRKFVASHTQNDLKREELGLLAWLFNNSSDPALRSCVTQALAGLRSSSLELLTYLNRAATIPELRSAYTRESKVFALLFDLGTQAMDQLRMAPSRGYDELASSGGSIAARLAIAMSEIYSYALTWQLCSPEEPNARHGDTMRGSTIENARKITGNIFDTLDLVWAETSPALTPSAYAYLATAEIKIVRHTLEFLRLGKQGETPTSPGYKSIDISTQDGVQARLPNAPNLEIDSLQERASHALSRTALVIKSCVSHLTSKGSKELQSAVVDLLVEASELVRQMTPKCNNLASRLGTPLSSRTLNQNISITVLAEDNTTCRFTCRRQVRSFELMESLVELCRGTTNLDTPHIEGFRVATFNLLVTFWPAYLQQWRIDEHRRHELPSWMVRDWDIIPLQNTPYDPQTSGEIIIYHHIVFTYVSIGLRDLLSHSSRYMENWGGVLTLILDSIISGSSSLPKTIAKMENAIQHQFPIYQQWLPTNETLENWIRYTVSCRRHPASDPAIGDQITSRLSWCFAQMIAMVDTLNAFDPLKSEHLTTQPDDATRHHGLRLDEIMQFIHAASRATSRSNSTPGIASWLDQLTNFIRDDSFTCKDCLRSFTEGEGFDILKEIIIYGPDSATATTILLAVMCRLYALNLRVDEKAFPSIIEAMQAACDLSPYPDSPSSFVRDALFQLQHFSDISQPITWKTCDSIQDILYDLKLQEKYLRKHGHEALHLDEIASLKNRVQQYMDGLPSNPPGTEQAVQASTSDSSQNSDVYRVRGPRRDPGGAMYAPPIFRIPRPGEPLILGPNPHVYLHASPWHLPHGPDGEPPHDPPSSNNSPEDTSSNTGGTDGVPVIMPVEVLVEPESAYGGMPVVPTTPVGNTGVEEQLIRESEDN
ncbi:hypothetical protein OPQ81_005144 [Rhizoctonia solani]|nr:hypothetical protein OPQ81_005144 [Rhizoctonia solani]